MVLRVTSLEDADKIITFVDSNKYFDDNKLEANPFLYDTGTMGVAVDGEYSYNSQVATLVKDYIINRYQMNSLDNVSVEDFHNFVTTLPKQENQNIQEINKLVGCATNGKNDLNDYVRHFVKVNRKFKKSKQVTNFNVLEYGLFTTACNHGVLHAMMAFHRYITTGIADGLSRFNKDDGTNINFREEISKIDPEEIKNYLNSKYPNMDLNAQINSYVSGYVMQKYFNPEPPKNKR